MDESTTRSRHRDSIGQAFLWTLVSILVLFLIAQPAVILAQVVTNITSTPGAGDLGTIVTPDGNLYDITGGTRPGGGPNLFHSFGDFSVGSGDVANFLNDSGLATSNIIGRVTELGVAHTSYIYGTIQTTGFDVDGLPANLFLVNPSGIVFGPQGSVDVGGSVSFSTAQYLRLFDSLNGVSANFYADPASDSLDNSVLVMDPVASFGFLPAAYGFLDAPNPLATIAVQGSDLSVLPGQSISLIGGKVIIESGTPDGGTAQPTQLSAPNGGIQLATAASPGEFDVNTLQSLPNNPVDPASAVSFTSYGSVSLAPGSSVDVSGARTVFIIGGQLVLSVNEATLNTSESLAPSDTVSLSPGSSIVTSNSGADPGADVQITVGNLNLDGSAVTTENLGDGIGGNITANLGTLSLANGASLNSNNFSFTFGDDGNFIFGNGEGGNLTIQGRTGADSVADSVMLSNGSTITTQTISFEQGGDVVIAAGDVHLNASTIYTGTFAPGQGGNVHITADSLTLENISTMTTETSFLGEIGGDLLLNVGTLRLMGGEFGGSLIQSVNGPGADLDGDEVIDVIGKGKGGNITIQGTTQEANSAAHSVVLSGSSGITSGALAGSGGGGRIAIRAGSLDLIEASVIKSSTLAFGTDLDGDGMLDNATGGGGDILLSVQNLRVVDGATITSSTALSDTLAVAGGMVTVEGLEGPGSKAGSVLLSGQNTGIQSDSAAGLPGDLTVNAGILTITNGAVIATGIAISGPAGNVGVTADSVVISAGGRIFSQSAAQDAGHVTLRANDLTLDDGSIETSTSSVFGGRGGDVVLNGGTVSLTNGASINSQSEAVSNGRAGDITITGRSLTMANRSEITSSSKGVFADAGDAGNITIQSGSTVLLNDSSITTEAKTASGGQITINAPEMIRLTNSEVSTSVAGSDVDTAGGNITIDPQFVILQNSQIVAQAFAGSGGAIDITANVFLADPASIVDATSQLGISGTVNIQAPVQNVSGELVVLSQNFSSAAALLAQQCAARVADGKFSTFVVAAREGLPVEPGGFLASPSFLTELGGSALSGQPPRIPHRTADALFQQDDAKPLQLAKLGSACR